MKDILSCAYTAPDGSGWKLERIGNAALLTKLSGGGRRVFRRTPRKVLSVDIILNLKMFFRDLAPEWNGLPISEEGVRGSIELSFSDEKFLLPHGAMPPEEQKNVVADLLRYFEAVFGGTYKECSCPFRSFEGGGPEYTAVSDGRGVFTWSAQKEYIKKGGGDSDGAAYNMHFTFWPLRPGEGSCVITGTSPIVPKTECRVIVKVNGSLAAECFAGAETEVGGPEEEPESGVFEDIEEPAAGDGE